MLWNTTSEGPRFTLLALLTLCVSCQAPQEPRESLKTTPGWPPRVIYNTDGNWVFNYLPKRDTGDLTAILDALQDTAVDIVTVLVGIDDDLSWRGSDHGQLWGDNTEDWNPDGQESNDSVGGMDMSDVERLHRNMAAIIEDGHDLLKIYIDRARDLKLGILASFRMNDGHTSYEDRGWYGRSALKLKRTDLLLGSPAAYRSAARADEWGFSWQWDYAKAEVRERFLGQFDEVLSRYDFDGLELELLPSAALLPERAGPQARHHDDRLHPQSQGDRQASPAKQGTGAEAHRPSPSQHRPHPGAGTGHRDLDPGGTGGRRSPGCGL